MKILNKWKHNKEHKIWTTTGSITKTAKVEIIEGTEHWRDKADKKRYKIYVDNRYIISETSLEKAKETVKGLYEVK
jgi:hypothetical protein